MPDMMTLDQVARVLGPIGTTPAKPWVEKDLIGRITCLTPEICNTTIVWEPIAPVGGHVLFEVARPRTLSSECEWRAKDIVAVRFLGLPEHKLFESIAKADGSVLAHVVLNMIGNIARRKNRTTLQPHEAALARARIWLQSHGLLVPQNMWG